VELVEDPIDMKTNIKPGDRFRIIRNECFAFRQGKDSPEELLQPGDIIRVHGAAHGRICYDTERGRYNTIPLKDVVLVPTPGDTPASSTVERQPTTRRRSPEGTLNLISMGIFFLLTIFSTLPPLKSVLTTPFQKGPVMRDALMNLTNEPLVHDAIIRLIAGGGYLALGTLAVLFLRNVAVNLGKYGDRRRRLRLEDDEMSVKRQGEVARREAEDHDRFVQSEARKKEIEASYIAQIVRASLTSQPSGTGAVSEGRPPEILPGMWVKFVALPHTTIRRLPESGTYQSVPIKIGDCVQVRSVDGGTRSMVYDPGQGEGLQRVPIECVVPV
jgi:hypothetical protein